MEHKLTKRCACCTSPCVHATPPYVAIIEPASDSEKASSFQTKAALAEQQRGLSLRALLLWIMLWSAMVALSVSKYLGKLVIVDKGSKEKTFMYEYDSDCTQSAEWIPDYSKPWPPDGFEHRAYLTYTLPQSSDLLHFSSKGSLSYGKIDFIPAEEGEEDVLYNITVSYHKKDAPEKVKVCRLQEGSSNGVDIFTPWLREPIPDEEKMFFSVKVKLPDAKYRAFTTDFLRFSQTFSLWDPLTVFDYVSIKGVNMPIFVGALRTNSAVVSIFGGGIYARFNATDSLELKAVNAEIGGVVYLTHSGEADVANLTILNVNGAISSDIYLCTPNGSKHRGRYNVVSTSGGMYNTLRFWDAPVNSVLNVTSITFLKRPSMISCNIKLHETFEGTFALQSSPSQPPLVRQPTGKVEDPAGKGRERHVTFSETAPGIIEGAVSWMDKSGDVVDKEVGNVNLKVFSDGFSGQAQLLL